ncbi:DEAD/DEAH box helicase [Streptomyces acidiscabies]|uniref:DEAD/DEAH box helicase family protein n=2 Tax=Streptomyces acidiscabies TaxID=42234 RepID=A0ABU4LVE1_9ACTN|nr:DEAD/DEAH box helicase family protein [Streptomyces acidiscabies]MDX3019185.1 DEAD/DEAH box helicase family protein [Streptomyces acidiscabies]GAQ57800.1 ATP-dependent RNA helicase RhlE [Streptomyces acidiscabies]
MSPEPTAVVKTVLDQSARVLKTYAVDPDLITEHANGERRITQGGYGDRQLFELVQNAADEIADEPGGTTHVVLTDTHLYCANEGTPVTPEGAETILRMSMSRKRGGQIGRFGVGVKSVLVVTDAPQFFSRTGCFGFDREWSHDQIRSVPEVRARFDAEFESPVLRMARPLDESAERAVDPVLDELLGWATTVVRLPLLSDAAERLGQDMHGGPSAGGREEFPAGFQLFSPHVGKVVLEDRRPRPVVRRTLTVEQDGSLRTVREERPGRHPSVSRWRVFTLTHQPTDVARSSAGELHDRVSLDISWAVREYERGNSAELLSVPKGRGRFWSFFPTKYEMTLGGILNGAWKTNEDRQNLLDSSPFNQEMIRIAARLVVDSLPELAPAEDPAAYLPLLPGRSRESETVSWADRYLTERIWEAAAHRPSLPDQDGLLCTPRDLNVHPALGKDNKSLVRWLTLWNSYPGRPGNWLHPSAETTDTRSGKVEHILKAVKRGRASVREWLEALVADGTAAASAAAIRIVADMVQSASPFADEARAARIVLTEEHGMVAPVVGKVFRRTDQDGLRESLVYAAAALSTDPSLAGALTVLGIRDADVRGRFISVLEQGFGTYGPQEWTRFWELFHQAGSSALSHEVAQRVPDPSSTLYVRTTDGRFRAMRDCLLPGPVVTLESDASVAVDTRFHSDDMTFFRETGLRDRPTGGHRPEGEPWFEQYHEAMHRAYCAKLPDQASRPTLARIKLEGAPVGGPLHLLPRLSEEARAAFLAALPDDALVDSWTLQVGAQVGTRKAVVSPMRWMLKQHGRVATSQGIRSLDEAVGPQLSGYNDMLPVARISAEKARKLGLATSVEDVPDSFWSQLMGKLQNSEDDAFVGNTYVLLTRLEVAFPEDSLTRCRIGDAWGTRPDGEIAVAASGEEYRALRAEGQAALLTASAADAALLVKQWGMLPYADVISRETRHEPAGEPVALKEAYPTLRQMRGSQVDQYSLQLCSVLEEVTRTPKGMRPKTLNSSLQGSTVLVLTPADPLEALMAVDRELRWRMGESGCRQVLEAQRLQEEDQKVRSALKAVRESDDDVVKLLLLLGVENLRDRLPAGLLDSERAEKDGAEPDDLRIAQMAFNAHGDSILQEHARDLQKLYPAHAPASFTGSPNAVAFVTDLRFPGTFAGFRAPSLDAQITVEGPRHFPRLHDYQERLATNVFTMLDRMVPQRGMLSLPTGAGKTRVTAEAVIRWVKQMGQLDGPILWIAQTEELCEQAVQSWKFVWEKVGAETPLTINRLWSSHEAGPVTNGPHLVVATDAKLQQPNCLAADSYDWLRKAALVIVDEAHTAITPRYTEILTHLGLTASRTDRHLLGLTATPFRNTNHDETRRLINRFGGHRLDEDIFGDSDAYAELQRLGMLAQVEHRLLQGGTITLTQDEKQRAEQLSFLSRAAEKRLADDHDRSARIVAEISGMPDNWPVLVFATSVEHAKTLAAKLRDRDITASSVDSTTSPNDRRRRIEDFRSGRVRVLTNYGVLTQGFDAPATRAVVVARPVYSPNVYQQMIGRGLRGPGNGGKETCLILNVRDNVRNFDTALAFTQFEHLWSSK